MERVRPFSYTGLDYFGPLTVRIGRRVEKRYGAIFTCLTVRAIHLELASSLSTDSAIMAIRRFAARRGNPIAIYCDNGTNFRGADSELRKALKEWDQSKITSYLTNKGIEWHFNPPAAPHMGGCWERMVRSVKIALKAVLNQKNPPEETLLTVMVEAEGIVNSRPLTFVSSDSDDDEGLTPNHFLLGTSGLNPPLGEFTERDMSLRKQWRIAQRLTDCFWKRWVKEYRPVLVKRNKWHHSQNSPISLGSLVLLVDENMPRGVWLKGIVTRIFPGKDGTIRVVNVKTKLGEFRRPVAKLCIIFSRGESSGAITEGEDVTA